MKPLILGLYLSTVLSVAQAGAPLIATPSSHGGHQVAGTGADSSSPCSSLAAMLAGTTHATDLNQYTAEDLFGPWNDALRSSGYPALTTSVAAPGFDQSLSGGATDSRNGERQRNPISHAILNSQTQFWAPDQPLGLNDSCPRYANLDDAVIRKSPPGVSRSGEFRASESQSPQEADVPKRQIIAMFLAGFLLLGIGARRRSNDPFD